MPVLDPGYAPSLLTEIDPLFLVKIGGSLNAEIPEGADLPPGEALVEVVPATEYSPVPDPELEMAGFSVFLFSASESTFGPTPPEPVETSSSKGALLSYYYYETFRRNSRKRRDR